MGIEFDYPSYYDLPPFTIFACDPHEEIGTQEGYKLLWVGGEILMFASEPTDPPATLDQLLESGLGELISGEDVSSFTRGRIDGVEEVTLQYTDTFGRAVTQVFFIKDAWAYTMTVRTGYDCKWLAEEMGHPDALDEIDTYQRMLETLRFIN